MGRQPRGHSWGSPDDRHNRIFCGGERTKQGGCARCRELADKMGLERVRLGSDGDQVSIWDGHSFVFNQSSWSLVNLYRMIRRRAAPPGLRNGPGKDLTA